MKIGRRAVLGLVLGGCLASSGWNARAAEIIQPARGSNVRKALLNTLRPHVETAMRSRVEFVVRTMNVASGFAFVVVDPQNPDGAPIDPATTVFRDEIDFMDGLTVYALLKNIDGGWIVLEHVIGPTDAAFVVWPEVFGAPRALFGLQ